MTSSADHLVIAENCVYIEPVYEAPKRADARHTHADVSKAREIIDYEPMVGIRERVSKFIDWCRENRDWYEPLVLAS